MTAAQVLSLIQQWASELSRVLILRKLVDSRAVCGSFPKTAVGWRAVQGADDSVTAKYRRPQHLPKAFTDVYTVQDGSNKNPGSECASGCTIST